MKVAQLCPILCHPMDRSLPGSSVHGIFQARILEWVAIPFSRESSQPRNETQVSHITCRFFTIWATREGPGAKKKKIKIKIKKKQYWNKFNRLKKLSITKKKNFFLMIVAVTTKKKIVVQLPSHVQLFATPWTAACQASLSFTVSPSLLRLMFIELVIPSPPLSPPSPPALNFSRHQGLFQWVGSFHQMATVLELQQQSFQWIFRLIFFRMDWFDVLAVQGTLRSLL